MKTTTYAKVALLVGPFTQEDITEIPERGDKGLEFLKEKYGDGLVTFVYFDIKETEFQGLKFVSEPHNQQRVDVMDKDSFEKRINAEREELSEAIGDVIASLTGETEPDSGSKPKHTLH